MTKKELMELDIRDLSGKSARIFEESDIYALLDHFGECKSNEEIDAVSEEIYDLIFSPELE